MKRRQIKSALERMNSCSTRLYGFIERAEKLQDPPPPASSARVRFATSVKEIQDGARRTVKAICQTWCKSHTTHSAGLLLEPRIRYRPQQNRAMMATDRDGGNGLVMTLAHAQNSTWVHTTIRIDEASGTISSQIPIPIIAVSAPTEDTIQDNDTRKAERIHDLCFTLENKIGTNLVIRLDHADVLWGAYEGNI
ncbi:hypothetical protein F4778DRAFT_728615 [Xylariomycetidae sp. FL2044]|nr:hypothetical protein F4778DRAFT_728615 [Xylariomycetidae sp. FL2044]